MSNIKNRLTTLVGGLVLLLALGKFVAAPAIAQAVRAAIVKNIDERGRNPYVANVSCTPTSGSCTALGTQVPDGMRLVVENVNIFVAMPSSTGTVQRATMYVNTGQNRAHELGGGTYAAAGATRLYSVNTTMIDYVEAEQIPSISLAVSSDATNSAFFGTITGYLVNLNN